MCRILSDIFEFPMRSLMRAVETLPAKLYKSLSGTGWTSLAKLINYSASRQAVLVKTALVSLVASCWCERVSFSSGVSDAHMCDDDDETPAKWFVGIFPDFSRFFKIFHVRHSCSKTQKQASEAPLVAALRLPVELTKT